MCGFTGIMAFNEIGRMHMIHLAKSTELLKHRGPDYQFSFVTDHTALGHRRLSVIDPSPDGHQPMTDASGRYTLVYNGEIYNYKELRQSLKNAGTEFRSDSDTEVLLQLFIKYQEKCLEQLNGCFAFAVYDAAEKELTLARDRYGINPLLYYLDDDKFVFGSEMRSLVAYNIPKELDYQSLSHYLQLNYIPAPHTIIKGVKKLLPGHFLRLKSSDIKIKNYYDLQGSADGTKSVTNYQQSKQRLSELIEQSVVKRLVSDVPLGAFLSGGLDSSVVVALASKHTDQLDTFSIGFPDQSFFDETKYAQLVSDKFGTNHTVFNLRNQDLFQHLFELWDHLDEPFADSSALPSYILSKYTRKSVTVALSGDGADELFGGYHKHLALQRSLNSNLGNLLISSIGRIAHLFPKSRNGAITNKFRQLDRFARGLKLDVNDRYWYWASIVTQEVAHNTLNGDTLLNVNLQALENRRQQLIAPLGADTGLNEFLLNDLLMVLPNDMLTKVDWMSMAHGLEVRVPFLDHELVNYVTSLPADTKVSKGIKKRILRETYQDILPHEICHRPKKGIRGSTT